MTQHEATELVVQVLTKVQQARGLSFDGIEPDQAPIETLENFDSLVGIEATVEIEQQLGCELELDSLFVSEDGRRALKVREISQRLVLILDARQAAAR